MGSFEGWNASLVEQWIEQKSEFRFMSLKNVHSDWQTFEDFQTMLYPKIED